MSLLNVLVFAFATIVENEWQRAIALMTVESIIARMNVWHHYYSDEDFEQMYADGKGTSYYTTWDEEN